MHKLSDKFGSNALNQMKKIPKSIREAIMEEHEVRFMEDLNEEGWIGIQVPVKDASKIEALKARIAEAMNIDFEGIDLDEDDNFLYAEMTLGSSEVPWPVFAYELFTEVDEAVSGLGHRAEAVF